MNINAQNIIKSFSCGKFAKLCHSDKLVKLKKIVFSQVLV